MNATTTSATPPKVRYLLPDTVRGLLVLAMAVYHTLFDLCYLFDVNMPWFRTDWMRLIQVLILAGFLCVSGLCYSLGRSKLKRAVLISVCGLAVTAVTWLFMPAERVVFGVLTCIGACMLLMLPLEKPLDRLPPVPGAILFFLSALFTYGLRHGYLGLYTLELIQLPDALYSLPWLFPLGLPDAAFSSSDYVPLVPWFFVYVAGFFIWRVLQRTERSRRLLHRGVPWLAKIGRYSLPIYLVHQPLLYGILWLLFRFI